MSYNLHRAKWGPTAKCHTTLREGGEGVYPCPARQRGRMWLQPAAAETECSSIARSCPPTSQCPAPLGSPPANMHKLQLRSSGSWSLQTQRSHPRVPLNTLGFRIALLEYPLRHHGFRIRLLEYPSRYRHFASTPQDTRVPHSPPRVPERHQGSASPSWSNPRDTRGLESPS